VVDDVHRETLAREIFLKIPALRAEEQGVLLACIKPDKPTQNAFIARLTGRTVQKGWIVTC
jgi:hypothetical protein